MAIAWPHQRCQRCQRSRVLSPAPISAIGNLAKSTRRLVIYQNAQIVGFHTPCGEGEKHKYISIRQMGKYISWKGMAATWIYSIILRNCRWKNHHVVTVTRVKFACQQCSRHIFSPNMNNRWSRHWTRHTAYTLNVSNHIQIVGTYLWFPFKTHKSFAFY